ncbi:MAG: TonB-dependent receptor [Bacteroidota bacterium]
MNKRYITALCTTFLCLLTATVFSQKASVEGIIFAKNDNAPLIGITVFIESINRGTATDVDGKYQIDNLTAGTYQMAISGIGYETMQREFTLSADQQLVLDVVLEETALALEEVVVLGKSLATQVREQAYAVEVIESKGFKNLSTNANDILGKISGVNIRQSGGLGSDFSLSLNGLSGNQVRIFLDGVPMDYFGTSLSLNNFSANLLERIEVYKGVVPIHLSSDALGGAINVITGGQTQSYVDASYSVGSFGTHIASLNGQFSAPNKSGFTVRLKSFYNTAQNNYEVPVNLLNFETGKADETPTYVERFHDAYNAKMIWTEVGFMNTKFADRLFVGALFSDNYKELQQPANAIGQAKIPYGEVTLEEDKTILNFTYSKSGLLNQQLNLNAYLVGVFSEQLSRDTSSFRYDWFGQRTPSPSSATGEIENRKTLLTLETNNYLGNLNAEYKLAKGHSVAANYSLNYLDLQGNDPFKNQNNTQFANPNIVNKQVLGLNYTNALLGDKLKNTVFTKLYDYRIESLETNYQGTEITPFRNEKNYIGFGVSSTYQLEHFQLKASYENATRFPEIIELFGDGLNFVPSPTLLPEQSNNFNVGFIYNNRSAVRPVMVSVNTFLRDASDFIIPQVQGIKVFHINSSKVLSRGVDLGSSFNLNDKISFNLNGTYLDLRDNNRWRNGEVGLENTLYKIRLPNVPYLFGNFSAFYRVSDFLAAADNFSVSLSQNYVHSFFYRWENLASQGKGIVPAQWTTNLEFVYSMNAERYNVSFGIINLWDAEVFDNFQQLRPGRTFNFKFRYFVSE